MRDYKNTSKTVIKIAILCICLTDCANGAITAGLETIAQAWPDVSTTMIQNIGSFAALAIGLSPVVLYVPLAAKLRKRAVMWIGIICFLVGGIGPAFVTTHFAMILLFRVILGCGLGILTPLGMDLCCAFFEGNERGTMLGLTSTMTGISGVIFQTLGGIFAGVGWNWIFYTYIAGAIFFAVAVIFLPEPPKQEEFFDKKDEKLDTAKEAFPKLGWVYGVLYLLLGCGFYTACSNVAMVGIGEGYLTPVNVSMCFNGMTLMCVITGILFGPVLKRIGYWILPIALVLGGCGLFILSAVHSYGLTIAGLALVGCLLGLGVSGGVSKVTTIAPDSRSALASAVPIACWNLGQFFQPTVTNAIVGPGRPSMVLGGCVVMVIAIIFFILEGAFGKKKDTKAAV